MNFTEGSTHTHTGTIIEASNNTRIAEVKEDKTHMSRHFPFEVIENYQGQTMRGMGLLPGRTIEFDLVDIGAGHLAIDSVRFPFEDNYRRILGWKFPFQDYLDDAFPGSPPQYLATSS